MPTIIDNFCFAECRVAFSLFDKDGDGTISAAEIKRVMVSLGGNPSDKEISSYNNILFIVFIAECRVAFSLFDKDGDGTISSAEMKRVMVSLGGNPSDKEVNINSNHYYIYFLFRRMPRCLLAV